MYFLKWQDLFSVRVSLHWHQACWIVAVRPAELILHLRNVSTSFFTAGNAEKSSVLMMMAGPPVHVKISPSSPSVTYSRSYVATW